ncbi:hypothetical protein Daura_12470 [Dactylosporangium aurantiacum]|uniref:Lipoprotein n=1 Tax=Dactylosporangium aurantiacum TaxID=35754 RepID=A0A9Q9IL81_9ACTN|nr:hypothetical protein [Dactylosporangium aurantiacum]MDG6104071.1 hypothetical protein [Dactylosporangium aurantiacum]UWZ56913.1 hypothetical protein Daura_12470 [Dactylosporangium aurantiacum]
MTRALLPVAFAAIALAGCSSEDPADTTAAPANTAASSAAPAAGTSSAAAPTSAAPAASGPAGGGCPVDATTLQKAFQANAEVAGSILLGKGFKDISCYQGYATALTQPEAMDAAVVVFKYDAAKKTWAAVMGGTDGVCQANVPAEIRSHLKHCG